MHGTTALRNKAVFISPVAFPVTIRSMITPLASESAGKLCPFSVLRYCYRIADMVFGVEVEERCLVPLYPCQPDGG